MGKINVAFAADNNYAQHVAVAMASVMTNVKSGCSVRFFLLSDGIETALLERIKETASRFCAELIVIDLSKAAGFEKVYTSGHISRAAYFRLALPDILPPDVTKIIYLDTDLLVLGDITKLWDVDLEGLPLAAVPDYGIMASKRSMKEKEKTIRLPAGDAYFNSGVMVMDVGKWREHGYTQAVVDVVAKHELRHHDQDALNWVFAGKWKKLPLSWNVIPPVMQLLPKILRNGTFRKNALAARRSISILHYAGRCKPWEFVRAKGFNESYYDYLALTAFAKEPMPKPGAYAKEKSLFRQQFKIKLADCISRIL